MSEIVEPTKSLAESFKPRGEYLLLQVHEEEKVLGQSGIIIPDTSRGRSFREGTVLKLGEEAGRAGIKVGDRVLFAREHTEYGTEKLIHYMFSNEGEGVFHVLKWFDVVGVLTQGEDATYPKVV